VRKGGKGSDLLEGALRGFKWVSAVPHDVAATILASGRPSWNSIEDVVTLVELLSKHARRAYMKAAL
jgi:hypothetical protein